MNNVVTRCPKEESQALKAFLALHEFMEPAGVTEVLSALLLLPQSSLQAGGAELSVYGQAVLTILTNSPSASGTGAPYLSSAHLCSLCTLYSSCHSAELEDVLLQVRVK